MSNSKSADQSLRLLQFYQAYNITFKKYFIQGNKNDKILRFKRSPQKFFDMSSFFDVDFKGNQVLLSPFVEQKGELEIISVHLVSWITLKKTNK